MKTRENHYNALKFFATILVVFAHASRMYTGEGVVNPINTSTLLDNATRFIYSFHMPLFIAISGMIYGHCIEDLDKYKDTGKFLVNKMKRLLIPYLFFGLFYVAPVMVVYGFTGDSYFKYCFYGILLSRDSRHLWYIGTLFGIFVVSLFANKIVKGCNIYLSFAILALLLLLSVFSHKLTGNLQISNCAYYLVYFYLGYFYNRYYEKLYIIHKLPALIILFFIQILAFKLNIVFVKYLSALVGGLVCISLTSYMKMQFMNNRFVKVLSKNGFGIYLFHPMIIYILYYYLGGLDINPIVLCVGITVVSYFLSVLLTEIFRKARLTLLIGEG